MIQKYFISVSLIFFLCGCESSLYKGMPTGSKSITESSTFRTIEVPVESTASATNSNRVRKDSTKTSKHVISNERIIVSSDNIYWAASDNNIDDIYHFYRLGVNIDAVKPSLIGNQGSPLHFAAKKDSVEAAEFLLELGADTHIRDSSGNTALHVAAKYNSFNVATALLNKGIRINEVNDRKETALLIAARRGHFEVIEVLVQYGPDLGIRNRDGKTAREIARRLFYRRIARLLREHEEEIEEQIADAMERIEQSEIDENKAKKIKSLAPL